MHLQGMLSQRGGSTWLICPMTSLKIVHLALPEKRLDTPAQDCCFTLFATDAASTIKAEVVMVQNKRRQLTWRTDLKVRILQPYEALTCDTMCHIPPGNDRWLHAKTRVSARVTLMSRVDARSSTFHQKNKFTVQIKQIELFAQS